MGGSAELRKRTSWPRFTSGNGLTLCLLSGFSLCVCVCVCVCFGDEVVSDIPYLLVVRVFLGTLLFYYGDFSQ